MYCVYRRGISQFLAILIVLTIVIGAGVFISTYLPRFIRSQTPHGGELMIISAKVDSYGPKPKPENFAPEHRIEIIIRGVFQGTGSIEIRRVYTNYSVPTSIYLPDTRQVTVEFIIEGNKIVEPNSYVKLYGDTKAPKPPEKIPIIIEYCFIRTNQCETTTVFVNVNFHYTS